MDRLDVNFQRMGGAEPVGALIAAELFPVVFLHVPPQPRFSEKFGTADLALLCFFTVAQCMLPEARLVLEGFVARRECAWEGALLIVVSHVVIQVCFIFKHFTTLWTQSHRLGLVFLSVLVQVYLKASFGHGREGLVALFAKPTLFFLVLSHVLADLTPRRESQVALRAVLLVCAGFEMLVQGIKIREGFRADVAGVDSLAVN